MNCTHGIPRATSPSARPTLLTSHGIQSTLKKPVAAASSNCIYLMKQLSVPLKTAKERGKWVVAPWKFDRDLAPCNVAAQDVPETGNCQIFEGEYHGLGVVNIKDGGQCYVREHWTSEDCEQYYEHEYHLIESTRLPGVQGYIGKITIFSDKQNPARSIATYRASWESGEVSDTFKAACKGAIDGLDVEPKDCEPKWIGWWGKELENTANNAICSTKHLSLPFKQAKEKAKWAALPWKFDHAVPEIGDHRTSEDEYPGFGLVKTKEKLLRYEDNDNYYEHEYHLAESTLLPGIQGYIGTMTIFSDTQNSAKSIVTYRVRWERSEAGDTSPTACKAYIARKLMMLHDACKSF